MEKSANKRALILFTSSYPYGTEEAYIENEIDYLARGFDEIIIVTNATNTTHCRLLPPNVRVFKRNYNLNFFEKVLSVQKIFTKGFWAEVRFVVSQYRLSLSLAIINTILQSLYKADKLLAFLKEKCTEKIMLPTTVCYSYWADDNAVALALLRKRNLPFKALCRAHRWDVYFEKNGTGYLPLRKIMAEYLNKIFFISENGLRYFENKTGKFHSLGVARLGVKPLPSVYNNNVSRPFYLLSCSALIPRKRVQVIAWALQLVNTNRKIIWTHIGSGPLFEELLAETEKTMQKNLMVEIKLTGAKTNNEVQQFYADNMVDLFLNVSESEGVPVAIMEAMSASVPCIATDVDGNSEIVMNEHNGFLLDKNFLPEDLAKLIERCVLADLSTYRQNAFNTWNEKYNAEKNYTAFVKEILNL